MSSFSPIRPCCVVATVIACVIFCLMMTTTTTTAMPMKGVVGKAMMRIQAEQQQQQQQRENDRQKRAVSRTNCARPDNLNAMFEQINAELDNGHFLKKLYGNTSISIPAGEDPVQVDTDPNESKTCPSSLTTDNSAPLAHRSLCPYYFKTLVLPEGYYPPSLKTAVCKCVKCVQHNAYGCEAVKTRIAVLKPLGCFQGLQRYEEQIFEVNAGCMCATSGSVRSATSATPITTVSPWWVE